jgi:V/A-type H+-transporting ATPase subunit I
LKAKTCLRELAEEKAPIEGNIKAEAVHREELKLCVDSMSTKIARAEATERLMGTSSAVALLGWVPVPEEEKLSVLLEKYDCAWETFEPSYDEQAQIPIKVKNSKLTSPMSMVTEMYSLPAYNGIDANPLIFPFFTVFFGIMFADMGYGLLMFIAGLLVKKKARPRGTMKHMSELLIICGISTFVFGFISGGFFGDAIPVIAGMFGHTVNIWFLVDPILNPIKNPLTVLIGAMILGVIQILVGMSLNAYLLIRDGSWRDALYDVGSWWLLFAGIALGALGVTWYVCFAGIAALILTQGRHKPTIIGKIVSGVASLYNITSYFGDILSYSRIMALMLAGTVIASVVNTLGSLNGSIIIFAVIFLIGHAFNIILNLIGCYVHTSRLQYLEYFGKYYRDGGRPFKPLAVNTKFVDILKED